MAAETDQTQLLEAIIAQLERMNNLIEQQLALLQAIVANTDGGVVS